MNSKKIKCLSMVKKGIKIQVVLNEVMKKKEDVSKKNMVKVLSNMITI